MNEKKERKGKKILLSCIAVALVAAISVGTTLALSKAHANELTNTFTTPNISLSLIEETWDGDTDGDGSGVNPDDGSLTPNKTAAEVGVDELGKEQASGYTSGAVINKDPKLKNTSEYGEYVALKLSYYVDGELVDAESFKTNVGSFTISAGWTTDSVWNAEADNAGSELYYYGSDSAFTKLDADGETSDLFQTIKVVAGDSGTVKKANGDDLTWDKMPDFEIKVIGYAVQSDNLTDVATIKSEIKSLIK